MEVGLVGLERDMLRRREKGSVVCAVPDCEEANRLGSSGCGALFRDVNSLRLAIGSG